MSPKDSPKEKDKAEKENKKDTVRKRKRTKTATQDFLPIAQIKNDTVVLKNGGVRAVLAVSSMNFSLKSEDEQQAIITSYQQFINTLLFPIQIVVRSRKLNVDAYLESLQDLAEKQKNPLIKEQTLDYANFVERLIDVSDIMQKNFYVIVPAELPGGKIAKASFLNKFSKWFSPSSDSREKALTRKRQFESLGKALHDRINMVQSGLENVGLDSKRLTTSELISLYYETYNPETSGEQKLPAMEGLNVKEYVL